MAKNSPRTVYDIAALIPCPKCGENIEKDAGRLDQDRELDCPVCHHHKILSDHEIDAIRIERSKRVGNLIDWHRRQLGD